MTHKKECKTIKNWRCCCVQQSFLKLDQLNYTKVYPFKVCPFWKESKEAAFCRYTLSVRLCFTHSDTVLRPVNIKNVHFFAIWTYEIGSAVGVKPLVYNLYGFDK